MKRTAFIVTVVLLWLMVTGVALALPKQAKYDMYDRSDRVTTDVINPCSCECPFDSATFVSWVGGYGYYVTSDDRVAKAKWIKVSGWQAEVVGIVYDPSGTYGIALLQVEMPEPCAMGPTRVLVDIKCFKDGAYVDESQNGGCGTVTKVRNQFECDSNGIIWTNTLPRCENCGAGLFVFNNNCNRGCKSRCNHGCESECPTLVGVLVDRRKDCCPKNPCDPCGRCGTRRQTGFMLIPEDIIKMIPSEMGERTAGVLQIPAPPSTQQPCRH